MSGTIVSHAFFDLIYKQSTMMAFVFSMSGSTRHINMDRVYGGGKKGNIWYAKQPLFHQQLYITHGFN